MSEKAWLVSQGEYSSYCIIAVFTDRSLVDAYIELQRAAGRDPEIEEYDLNPGADVLRARHLTWGVSMDWNGDNATVAAWGPMLLDAPAMSREWNPYSNKWSTWIIAPDADAARKAVNEQRLIAISEGLPRDAASYYEWLKTREGK